MDISFVKNKSNIALALSTLFFLFSLTGFAVESTIPASSTTPASSNCEWCNSGDCTTQEGGSGWTGCVDASEGNNQCGFYGDGCCVTCDDEDEEEGE